MPNCDQPEVITMITNKYGKMTGNKSTLAATKNLASTMGTIRHPNNSSLVDN